MNPQNDRGKRAEREAVKLLCKLTGHPVDRRRNAGIRLDVGDLIGLPDTAIQVSACKRNDTAIAARARQKVIDCGLQQARLQAAHGVTLLRIDGNSAHPVIWRALLSYEQLGALVPYKDVQLGNVRNTIGNVIRTCTDWENVSLRYPGIVCAPVETWATQWLTNQGTKVA